jgi:SAM-dependent methyltransferase
MIDPLVDAIHRGRLHEVAAAIRDDPARDPSERTRAAEAVAVCEQIGGTCEHERERIVALLDAAGCEFDAAPSTGPRQHHTVESTVADYRAAQRAAAVLSRHGFEPWQQWTRGAERSACRFADELVVGATGDVTTVVRFRWGSAAPRSRLRRVFTPTSGDWNMIDLPGWAWPAYSLVRPARLVAERVGVVQRHDDGLGPFLSTPRSLVGPLLAFAGATSDDRLLDVGCGDGRVVVTAAEQIGCRAVGVERSVELVERARRAATDTGVADLVEIVHGDGRTADLAEATVVFMFLSMRVVADLVPATLQQLRPGARLVIHEQTRLPDSMDPKPDESVAVIADGAVTVAHRWTTR